MKRRKFITLSALAAAAISAPLINCTNTNPGLDKILALPQTLARLADKKTLGDIGKQYGIARQEEYSLGTLEQLLAKNSKGQALPPGVSAQDIYILLDRRIQKDFETGNIIVLNGWVLSLTEARQCALLSLMPQPIKN